MGNMGFSATPLDWNRIAQKFDVWLPHLAPVGDALVTALAPRRGDRILDLASGTGEPALTLARHYAELTVTGVDAAAGMVAVAQDKAAREGLANIRFQCMAAEQLRFADERFDRAVCRFGLMLFEDPLQALREIGRTLRRGGRFALAVWATPETMTSLRWTYEVLKDRLPEAHHPPLHLATSLGGSGVLEHLLREADFCEFVIDNRTVHYRFASFDTYWDLLEASDLLSDQYQALPESERAAVRDEIRRRAASCMGDEGLVLPHQYRLASGYKR